MAPPRIPVVESVSVKEKAEVVLEPQIQKTPELKLLDNEKVPSDWKITEENGKYKFVNNLTNRKLSLDSISEFNKLLRG